MASIVLQPLETIPSNVKLVDSSVFSIVPLQARSASDGLVSQTQLRGAVLLAARGFAASSINKAVTDVVLALIVLDAVG